MTAATAPEATARPRRRVLLVHPAMTPYRLDLFNTLAETCDLNVLFLGGRPWYDGATACGELMSGLACRWSVVAGESGGWPRLPFLGLSREAAAFGPDVITTHEFGWASGLATLTALVDRRVARVLWTTRSPYQFARLSTVRRAAVRLMAPRADALLAYSPAARTAVADLASVPESRIFICANHQDGTRLRRLAAEARGRILERCAREGLGGRPLVVTVSRLVTSKDVATTIRGFAAARDELPGAMLVVVGDGPLRAQLHDIARGSGVADRVLFLGHVPAGDVQAWLSIASLMVLASREEPFGAVVAEGLAHGVPCVCSTGAGAAVLIGRPSCGVVVPPGDVTALAEALRSRAAELRPLDDPALLARADLRPATVADDAAGFLSAVEHAISRRRHGEAT